MTTEALKSLELVQDPELRELVTLMTNLLTIQLALQQCPAFPYIKNIAEANDVAIMAVQSKMQLYFDSQTK